MQGWIQVNGRNKIGNCAGKIQREEEDQDRVVGAFEETGRDLEGRFGWPGAEDGLNTWVMIRDTWPLGRLTLVNG